VLDLDEDVVEETLIGLQKKGLVMKMVGGRAERYRHLLYELWKVTKVEMAILADLLLRGPQTEGDLRGRASRMDDIADLDELRTLLASLADRQMVVYLTERNRRGSVVTHGFHSAEELEREKARHAGGVADDPPPRTSSPPAADVWAEITKLKERVAVLEAKLGGEPG
jgi:hypothetical protein